MGQAEPTTRVVWPSIERRLRANGHDSVRVVVKAANVKGCPPDLIADVAVAVERANEAMDRDGEELVWAMGPVPTPKGPVIDIDSIGSDEQTEEWLDHLAEALERQGRYGEITAAPEARLPQEISSPTSSYWQPRPTAYLAYSMIDPLPPMEPFRWLVDAQTTAAICKQAVEWGSFEGATTYLTESNFRFVSSTPLVAEQLQRSVHRSGKAEVTYVKVNPSATRSTILAWFGEVIHQAGREGAHWSEHVDDLRGLMVRSAASVELALIRQTLLFGHSWLDLTTNGFVKLPHLRGGIHQANRHMWVSYIPDAFALQIVSQAHLDRAHDLSNWRLEKVADDRYLLEAKDLGAWFDGTPTNEVLQAARADFGEMILTREAIEADPHGWLPGMPDRTS